MFARTRRPRHTALLGRAALAALGVGASLACAAPALAFSYGTAVTDPCHEEITMAALREARGRIPTAPAIEPDSEEAALINDLPFALDPDAREVAGASLVIGVRDNDLKGRGPLSIDQLSEVHGDPATQREHCLRAPDQDDAGGNEAALADCRAFIRGRAFDALDALDASGKPDVDERVVLPLDLSIRGGVDASLPAFWVRLGQAMHALEDSFSHTYRTEDGLRVTTVLNFIDVADKVHDEPRDGPAHKSALDRCDDADELRARNHDLAIEASAALIVAALDPALDRAGKEAAIDDVLTDYLSYEPGCSFGDGWCDAPEAALPEGRGCGCSVADDAAGARSFGAAALVVALFAARRGRRGSPKRTRGRTSARLLGLGALAFASASGAPSDAWAQSPPVEPAPAAPPPGAPPAPDAAAPGATPSEEAAAKVDAKDLEAKPAGAADQAPRVVERGVTVDEAKDERKEIERSPFALAASISGSFDNPGAAGGLGLRLQLSSSWAIGLDAEFNPFYGVQSKSWRTGTGNAFATLIYRVPMRFEAINLRSTLHAGASMLLMDLYGAPKGTVGPYFGVSPLGLEWKLSRAFYMIVDPVNIALPIPQLSGALFAYPQYRATIGIEIAP